MTLSSLRIPQEQPVVELLARIPKGQRAVKLLRIPQEQPAVNFLARIPKGQRCRQATASRIALIVGAAP